MEGGEEVRQGELQRQAESIKQLEESRGEQVEEVKQDMRNKREQRAQP
jgi:hypothetical protein